MGKQESLQSQQEWDKNTSAFDAEICDKRARRKKALVLVFLILCVCVCVGLFFIRASAVKKICKKADPNFLLSSLSLFFLLTYGLLRTFGVS